MPLEAAQECSDGLRRPAAERGGDRRLVRERRDLERVRPRKQGPAQLVVERVPGLVRRVLADQWIAEQVQVADRVEHLVAHELVVVAQALAVEDLELVEHCLLYTSPS